MYDYLKEINVTQGFCHSIILEEKVILNIIIVLSSTVFVDGMNLRIWKRPSALQRFMIFLLHRANLLRYGLCKPLQLYACSWRHFKVFLYTAQRLVGNILGRSANEVRQTQKPSGKQHLKMRKYNTQHILITDVYQKLLEAIQ